MMNPFHADDDDADSLFGGGNQSPALNFTSPVRGEE